MDKLVDKPYRPNYDKEVLKPFYIKRGAWLKEKARVEAARKAEEARKAQLATQAAKVVPAPPVQASGDCERWRPLIAQYPWNVDVAVKVCNVESGGDQYAANWKDIHRDRYGNVICIGSFGLFQISCHSGQLFDPAQNIAAAYRKYVGGGWHKPWYTTCTYKVVCY